MGQVHLGVRIDASFLGLFTITVHAGEKSESLELLEPLNLATAFESSSVGGLDSMTMEEELLCDDELSL